MAVNPTMADGKRQLTRILESLTYRHSTWDIFSDWVEMMAISISNSCDKVHFEDREKRYMDIVRKYNKEELNKFAEAFACLVTTMEHDGLRDILGETFHELELHNKYKGQFFTPFHVCECMAEITIGDHPKLNDKGYITVCEPCSGSGAMVIGAAGALNKAKINYQKQMVVLANDIDPKCTHMCYVQLSLLGIPAVVTNGNSLTVEEWSRWYTPMYLIDNWIWREQLSMTTGRNLEDEKIKCWLQPMYYLLRYGTSQENKLEEKPEPKMVYHIRGGFLFEFKDDVTEHAV